MIDLSPFAIPYFEPGPWPEEPLFQIGSLGVQLQPFGLMVAIGVVLALWVGGRFAERRYGIPKDDFHGLGLSLLFFGWLGAHVLAVLLYSPSLVLENPWVLLDVTGSLSSFGGIVGGLLGLVLWSWRKRIRNKLIWVDSVAWALPFGWFFGRVGCALVHDHPGAQAPESWPLAIRFADADRPWLDGVRHDLGFYEAIWWLVILSVFVWADRKKRRSGFYVVALILLYTPVRFALEFLRLGPPLGEDVRYAGLTPAQYFAALFFLIGLALLAYLRRREEVPAAGQQGSSDSEQDRRGA